MADLEPIFVGGCPRSGTTMFASLLGAHPRVVAVPEAQFVVEAIRASHDGPSDLVSVVRGSDSFRLWGLDEQHQDGAFQAGADSIADLFRRLVEAWLRQNQNAGTDGDLTHWVDHTTWNLQYADLVGAAFPGARFLHVVRDGRAVAASVRKLDWGPHDIEACARWWAERVGYGLAAEQLIGPDRVLRVRYEDLVSTTEETLRRICSFIGIEYSDAMARGGGYEASPYRELGHALVDRPPDPTRVDAWRTGISDQDVERFEALAGIMLECFGYDCRVRSRAQSSRRLEYVRRGLSEAAHGYVLYPLRQYLQRRRELRSASGR